MWRVAGRALVAGVLLLGFARPALAEEPRIFIDYPLGTDFVSGLVEVVATAVSDEPVRHVDFLVDGKSEMRVTSPPYQALVDVGQDNVEHVFEVVLETVSGSQARGRITTPKLRVDELVDIELQQLYVTVTEGGRRRLDLERGDFRVLDEGTPQKIVTFERGDVPLTAVLLLDSSLSMTGERLDGALEGARVFLNGMRELDEVSVMLFSDQLLRATGFEDSAAELAPALEDVVAAGGTALTDHLFLALQQVERQQGRRVLVVFSDGADVHSVLGMDDVLEKARRSASLIYWIYLTHAPDPEAIPTYTSSWRDVDGNRTEFRRLRRAVDESGGRIQIVQDPDELAGAFGEILAELRGQYVIGYYPSERRNDGSWHNVRVRVDGGASVRTRAGYTDW